MPRFRRMDPPDPLPEGSYTKLTEGAPGDLICHVLVVPDERGLEWNFPYPTFVAPSNVPPCTQE